MSACQPGDFSSCVCENIHVRFCTHSRGERAGVWQTLLDVKLAFMALCVMNKCILSVYRCRHHNMIIPPAMLCHNVTDTLHKHGI